MVRDLIAVWMDKAAVAARWGRGRERLRDEFSALGAEHAEYVLRDAEIAPRHLTAVLERDPETDGLLARLMDSIGVDRERLLEERPDRARELDVICAGCVSWRRCRRELASGTAAEHFSSFCPNAAQLSEARASRSS